MFFSQINLQGGISVITLKAVQEYNIEQDEDINKISDSIDDLRTRLKRLENDI